MVMGLLSYFSSLPLRYLFLSALLLSVVSCFDPSGDSLRGFDTSSLQEEITSNVRGRNLAVLKAKTFRPNIVVAKDGSGHFKSLGAAIRSIRRKVRTQRDATLIYVKAGVYFEEVIVPVWMRYLTIVGDPGRSRIVYNKYSAKLDARGNPLGTANTGTLAVLADDFMMVGMDIRNIAPRPLPAVVGFQAVAFRSSGNRTYVYNSRFYSFQDTLYAHMGWQYYKNCYIYGEIDFVFGYAKAIFDGCTLYMDSLGYSGIAAQKKMTPNADNCFVFINCRVTGRNQGWLGRAWGKYSCTIYAYSRMDNVIQPDGWNNFMIPARQITSFFSEYRNFGIGANLEGRVWWEKVMSPADVRKYLTTNYIGLKTWARPIPIAPSSSAPLVCKSKAKTQLAKLTACSRCCRQLAKKQRLCTFQCVKRK